MDDIFNSLTDPQNWATCSRCDKVVKECECGEERVTPEIWGVPHDAQSLDAATGLMQEIAQLGPKPPQHDVVGSLLSMGFQFPTGGDIAHTTGVPKEFPPFPYEIVQNDWPPHW